MEKEKILLDLFEYNVNKDNYKKYLFEIYHTIFVSISYGVAHLYLPSTMMSHIGAVGSNVFSILGRDSTRNNIHGIPENDIEKKELELIILKANSILDRINDTISEMDSATFRLIVVSTVSILMRSSKEIF